MNALRRRIRTVAVATAAVLAIGLSLGQAFRDAAPPELWTEAPARVAAGEAFELFVSADEPATFDIAYGDRRSEIVDRSFTLALEALPGRVDVRVAATDRAGNRSETKVVVDGVVAPRGTIEAPERVVAGTPYAVVARFEPGEAERSAVMLSADGAARPLHGSRGERWALFAAPLVSEPGRSELLLAWRDGLDRPAATTRAIAFAPLDQEVEELRVPADTLAVVTPEGRALEAAALAAATPDPADPPRWSEPFVLPVEGRATSGFARARRYAPGGRVSFHRGEDIAAPVGTPIQATNDGVVVIAGSFPIKGGMTIIDHGAGVTSRYYHQARIDVEVGDVVRRGQVVGAVGSTGLSTGPHLHWEMRVADVASDPLAWVGKMRP